jgi:hypothetical protein
MSNGADADWVVGPAILVVCDCCGKRYDRRQRAVNPYTRWASCACGCSSIRFGSEVMGEPPEVPSVPDEAVIRFTAEGGFYFA